MSTTVIFRIPEANQKLKQNNNLARPASVAQSAEQLICNQQVVGSSPSASSYMEPPCFFPGDRPTRTPSGEGDGDRRRGPRSKQEKNGGGFPERSKGSDCKSDGNAFEGSNPSPPIVETRV